MRSSSLLLLTVLLAACDATATSSLRPSAHVPPSLDATGDGLRKVSGSGVVDLTTAGAGFMQFAYDARIGNDGGASGSFSQYREVGGLIVDFSGSVTCVTFEPGTTRAWVAGVITENRSTHPGFRVDTLHQPGMAIWFRTVDYGEGVATPDDRSTVFGFKWSAGIVTSAEYCATKPWPMEPVPDARTFPVSEGNVQVH
jgi:hypothetical protein